MAIVGRAKYTRARAKFRGDAARGERRKLFNSRVPFPRNFVRVRVYFARPTISIAKIRDYMYTQFTNQDQSQLGLSNFFAWQVARKIVTCNSNLNQNQSKHNITFDTHLKAALWQWLSICSFNWNSYQLSSVKPSHCGCLINIFRHDSHLWRHRTVCIGFEPLNQSICLFGFVFCWPYSQFHLTVNTWHGNVTEVALMRDLIGYQSGWV